MNVIMTLPVRYRVNPLFHIIFLTLSIAVFAMPISLFTQSAGVPTSMNTNPEQTNSRTRSSIFPSMFTFSCFRVTGASACHLICQYSFSVRVFCQRLPCSAAPPRFARQIPPPSRHCPRTTVPFILCCSYGILRSPSSTSVSPCSPVCIFVRCPRSICPRRNSSAMLNNMGDKGHPCCSLGPPWRCLFP